MNMAPLTRTRAYRQQARAEAAEETARRIAHAFADCVRDRWFDEITLEEVATKAGVAVRTVVRRFGDKEGLVAGYVRYVTPGILEQRTVTPGDWESAVQRVLELYEELGDRCVGDDVGRFDRRLDSRAHEPVVTEAKRVLRRGVRAEKRSR